MVAVSINVFDVNTIVFERDSSKYTLLRLPRYIIIFDCETGSILWVKEYKTIPEATCAYRDWVFNMCTLSVENLSKELSTGGTAVTTSTAAEYVEDAIRQFKEEHK